MYNIVAIHPIGFNQFTYLNMGSFIVPSHTLNISLFNYIMFIHTKCIRSYLRKGGTG